MEPRFNFRLDDRQFVKESRPQTESQSLKPRKIPVVPSYPPSFQSTESKVSSRPEFKARVGSADPRARDLYLGSDGVQEKRSVHGGRLSAKNMLNYLRDVPIKTGKPKRPKVSQRVQGAVTKAKKRVKNYDPYTWRRHNYSIMPKENFSVYEIISPFA